jgi:opacity protein-like surface antigen
MKKIFKGLAIASLLAASSLVSAQGWNFSGGYVNYSDDDISLGAIYASAGYAYESGNMEFMPELRLGVGVSDDTIEGAKVELDNLIIASIRGQYNVNESFGIFLQPSYGRLEGTVSAGGFSETVNDWEFGFGGGASFKVSDSASIEALYEDLNDTDVVSIGLRMTF